MEDISGDILTNVKMLYSGIRNKKFVHCFADTRHTEAAVYIAKKAKEKHIPIIIDCECSIIFI